MVIASGPHGQDSRPGRRGTGRSLAPIGVGSVSQQHPHEDLGRLVAPAGREPHDAARVPSGVRELAREESGPQRPRSGDERLRGRSVPDVPSRGGCRGHGGRCRCGRCGGCRCGWCRCERCRLQGHEHLPKGAGARPDCGCARRAPGVRRWKRGRLHVDTRHSHVPLSDFSGDGRHVGSGLVQLEGHESSLGTGCSGVAATTRPCGLISEPSTCMSVHRGGGPRRPPPVPGAAAAARSRPVRPPSVTADRGDGPRRPPPIATDRGGGPTRAGAAGRTERLGPRAPRAGSMPCGGRQPMGLMRKGWRKSCLMP